MTRFNMLRVPLILTVLVGGNIGELIINVSRAGEDASNFRQTLKGNTSSDIVIIEFITPDGTGVTQVTDLKSSSVITAVTIPGEEELGQAKYQVLCFVSAHPGDMITAEAMTKLRQKHPGTVRIAEEARGSVVQDNPLQVVVPRAAVLSVHLGGLCREAREMTFSSDHELSSILRGGDVSKVSRKAGQGYEELRRCYLTPQGSRGSCLCALQVCVNWYPCALKYCRNQSGEGEHRCGIRTCSKCTTFRYMASNKNMCSWDEL